MNKKTDQESFYELHLNKFDEVMISIHAKENEPVSPVLLYDGGEHALLYRTPQQTVLLDFIHPDARPYLANAAKVLIAETKNANILREYNAICRRVKSLPLDEARLVPLLNKSDALKIDDRDLYK